MGRMFRALTRIMVSEHGGKAPLTAGQYGGQRMGRGRTAAWRARRHGREMRANAKKMGDLGCRSRRDESDFIVEISSHLGDRIGTCGRIREAWLSACNEMHIQRVETDRVTIVDMFETESRGHPMTGWQDSGSDPVDARSLSNEKRNVSSCRSIRKTRFTLHGQPELTRGMRLDTSEEGVIACIEVDYS